MVGSKLAVGSLCSFGVASGLIRSGSAGSGFSFVIIIPSSSLVLMLAAVPSILRFFEATALAIAGFDLSRGVASVGGFSDGPPLGCIPFAFMSLSYRFALRSAVSMVFVTDAVNSRCSFANYVTFFRYLDEVNLEQLASKEIKLKSLLTFPLLECLTQFRRNFS